MDEHAALAKTIPADTPTAQDAERLIGFVPPTFKALAHSPANLRAAWAAVQTGYLENKLPAPFKERFLALIARECMCEHGVAVRCCSLYRLGLAPSDIAELLTAPLPSQSATCEKLRAIAAGWAYKSAWASMPAELEKWVLWATVRFATRRDPGGRCRELLCEVLDVGDYSMIVLLAGYAAMYRTWCLAHPELVTDDQTRAEYDKLVEQAPELGAIWKKMARTNKRHVTRRERKLMAEIGRQDRVREALRHSERRFRRIVENSPFPLMIYAEDGQVVMLNRAWEELSGWEGKDIPNVQTWMDKAQIDHADWSSQDLEALRGWDALIDEGEQQIQTRDGQIRRWSFSTAALGKLGDGRRAVMRTAVDVTERRELEDALWDTNRRMHGILDSITDGFIAMDRDTRFLYANEKLADILRIRRENLIGRLFTEVFPYVNNTPLNAAVQRCIDNRTTEHIEHYSPLADTFYEVHLYPTQEGVAGFIRDIGERKRIEQQLRASERRFRGLFESNMLGVMFANRFTGAILDCNDAMLRMIGYTREELKQGKVNWIQLTPPEHRSLDVPAVHEVGNGPLMPYEKSYVHKDGHRIPILIGGAPVNPGEDVVMAFVIDQTTEMEARAESQQLTDLVEAVVQSIPGPLLIFDLKGIVMRWNTAATAVFGWSAEEAIGRTNPLVPDFMQEVYRQQIQDVAQGRFVSSGPLPCVTKSGAVLQVRFKGFPVKDPNGKVVAVMGIAQE